MGETPERNDATKLDEFEIIERYFAPLAGKGARFSQSDVETFSLKDDAALISSAVGKKLVVTSDSLVSGVHFFGDEPAHLIAKKALRTNLSDLASKAATPVGYTLSLHLPKGLDEIWFEDFAKGLAADQKQFGCKLLGGDTVSSPVLAIAITAIGESEGVYPARTNAKVGDDIYVTGTLGDSALGLRARQGVLSGLDDEAERFLLDRYYLPQPRLDIKAILDHCAHASMDVSDGLFGDLGKLCKASKLAAQVNREELPFSQHALKTVAQSADATAWMLEGGDDYEVLFTAPPEHRNFIENNAQKLSFAVTRIGDIVAQCPKSEVQVGLVSLIDQNGDLILSPTSCHNHRF